MLQTGNRPPKVTSAPKLSRHERSVRAARRLGEKLEAHAEARQGQRLGLAALRRRLRVSWARLRPFGIKPPSERSEDDDRRYPVDAFRELLAAGGSAADLPEEEAIVFYVRNRAGEVSRRYFDEAEALVWANVKNSSPLREGGEPLWYVEPMTATVRPTR